MATQFIPKEVMDTIPKQIPVKYEAGRGNTQRPAGFDPESIGAQADIQGRYLVGYYKQVSVPGLPEVDAKGFPLPKFLARYDINGVLQNISASEPYWATTGQGENDIFLQPKFNPQGELVETGENTNKAAGGSDFISQLGRIATETAPIWMSALGANLFSGVNLLGGGAGAAGATTGVDMAPVGDAANATSSYTGATSAPPPSGMFSAPVSISSPSPVTTGGEGLFTSSSYTQPIVTSPEGLISPAPSVDVAASIPSITPSAPTTAPPSGGYTTPSNEFMGPIAPTDTGAIDALLTKAAALTGLGKDTLAKLGVAAVQTLISSAGANKIADKATDAAKIQADAQIEAARIAAEAAKFRPVGVTTRFGSSNFGYDAQGNVTTAGYTPSAEITGYQDRLRALAGQGMTDIEAARAAYAPLTGAAKSLFSLGESYLAKSPEAVAADYISKQQALISPSRQTQLAELQNKLFQQGRGGAAVSQGGNLMATSPEYAAYYNAIAQQDLALAARADQEARDRISFGSGLFDTGANLQGRYYTGQTAAYAPFATAMDTSAALESLAERPLTLGTSIGERTTAGTAAGGRFLSEGITNAAATMAPSNAFTGSGEALSAFSKSPEFKSALNNIFGVGSPEKTYTAAEVLKLFGT